MSSQEPAGTRFMRPELAPVTEPEPLRSILPNPLTPLVGREHALAACKAILDDSDTRLLTLAGPGGVGKTRLALALGHTVQHLFPHGVVFVGLADITAPELVLPAIARALGATDDSQGTPLDRCLEVLQDRRVLLILDNFEHIVGAAFQIAELLHLCPKTRMVVTSRIALRIRGEKEFQVLPLMLPRPSDDITPENLGRVESVTLFLLTVRGFQPGFRLDASNVRDVAEICRRLDGLPLAIELAASRMRSLTPGTLLEMLDQRLRLLSDGPRDLPERQRTLKQAIQWSYDLLTADEQALFRQACVFMGGFEISALAAVSGVDAFTTAETVERLVDHHLIRRLDSITGEPRFWLLETIRDFGLEMMAETGDIEDIRQRHAEWCLAFAAQAHEQLTGKHQIAWMDRVEREVDNIRAAITWAIACQPSIAVRIPSLLWRFGWVRGYSRQLQEWLRDAMTTGVELSATERADALFADGELSEGLTNLDDARRRHEEALALREEIGDESRIADSLNALGVVARTQGDLDRAEELHTKALPLTQRAGTRRAEATTHNNLGAVAYYRGNPTVAQTHWERALEIAREADDLRAIGTCLTNLGAVANQVGDTDRAIALQGESLEVYRRTHDIEGITYATINLSGSLVAAGEYERARDLLEAALPGCREIGDRRAEAVALFTLGEIAGNTRDHVAAASSFAASLVILARTGQMPNLATCLEALGRTASDLRLHEDAILLFAAASRIREETGAARESMTDAAKDDEMHASRAALGRAKADQLWERGVASPIGDVLQLSASMPQKVHTAVANGMPDESGIRPPLPYGLTKREFEILGYLVQHHTDREIGDALFISPRTVTTHVGSIINKLGVSSRREAARMAEEHHLV